MLESIITQACSETRASENMADNQITMPIWKTHRVLETPILTHFSATTTIILKSLDIQSKTIALWGQYTVEDVKKRQENNVTACDAKTAFAKNLSKTTFSLFNVSALLCNDFELYLFRSFFRLTQHWTVSVKCNDIFLPKTAYKNVGEIPAWIQASNPSSAEPH